MAPRTRERTRRPSDSAQDAGEPPDGVRVGVGHGERAASVVRGDGISAFLDDAAGDDRDVALDKALMDGLADDDLLWVDVDSSQKGAVARVTDLIPVDIESMSVAAATILRDRADNDVIGRLVELRHDIGRLRRRLSPHRQVFATPAHPSFDVISDSSATREFGILADRLEMAVQAVHATRETVVGAFDVFMTQTAQRTNNDLRVLTTVSLALPPATVVASTLGMNIMPKYMLHSWVYWAALALILVIGAVVFVTMRALRHWL